ncbi:NHLP-related RiPP peptide [Marilutibacter alkalisoli]|uniref:Putative modified peptide n=1 Tax=Marilutibacter alkalisoli TaxID=2591633 RepID=A0A514BVH8_9GAMM|nr:NHLP-related RiPP peptide [Lysobacter alkalisoli]QDH71367.1 putative modified peptide [Lysobacter alkalisoli]
MSTKTRTAPLSPEIADRLLDLLSTDDLFRERFQRDHLAALRSIGYESPAPGQMTACGTTAAIELEPFAECKVNELAAKETIAAARAEIKSMLIKGLAHNTPQLDAALKAERRVLK